jgi:hypothetical protein
MSVPNIIEIASDPKVDPRASVIQVLEIVINCGFR